MAFAEGQTRSRYENYILLLILAFAFFIAMIPKLNYPYAVHVDEWTHWAYSQAVVTNGSITFVDPLIGQKTTGLVSNLEIGYHVYNGIFQMISGVPWLVIVRYLPALVFVFTVLSVYILARRQGFGLAAAFFTCLISTTVGIPGPAFFVAVGLGLLFLPLLFFLLLNYRNWSSLLLVLLIMVFLMLAHPPSAVIAVLALVPFYFINFRYDWRHNLKIVAIAFLFICLTIPFLIDSRLIVSQVKTLFVERSAIAYHDIPMLIVDYGMLATVVALIGIVTLTWIGGKRNLSVVLGTLAVSSMLAVFHTFRYGMAMLYLRGLLYIMLFLGIVAGAGLTGIRRFVAAVFRSNKPYATGISLAVSLAVVVTVLGTTITHRLNTPYYHMIDDQDYSAFTWIQSYLDGKNEKGILDPWKATAFSAVTGFPAYSRIEVAAGNEANRTATFLTEGAQDTNFLVNNKVSVVYSPSGSNNPDLIEVRNDVFIRREK
jgi:hypothetical protein